MHNEHTRTPADLPANPAADSSGPADRRAMLAGIGGLAAGALLLSTRSAQAGPLTPPAGPVAPTGKTTQELFDKVAASEPRIAINATNTPGTATSLFKIGAPGSYYLTGNIQGVSGKHGIEIAGGGVSLDLNGFDMVGAPGSLDGIRLTLSGQTNLTLRNGSLRLWRGCGIDLSASAGNVSIHDINADSNTLDGIRVGNGAVLARCNSGFNGENGLSLRFGGRVEGCSATWNGQSGIQAFRGCTIDGCSVSFNTQDGINADNGSIVRACSAWENGGDGIAVQYGCSVIANASNSNGRDGIRCFAACQVLENVCNENDNGAGIRATFIRNRIDGNICRDSGQGISIDNVWNIITRNCCGGNDINWQIAGGNIFGPIVDRRTPGSAAVSGNAAGGTLGTTDPSANFTL